MTRTNEHEPFHGLAKGLLLATIHLPLAGCGFFTAGVAASSGRDGGNDNTAPAVSALDVRGELDAPKTSPAMIELTVADAEGDPATVELAMVLPDDPGVMRPLTAVAENPVTLTTSRAGETHAIVWDFASEPGLPAEASYVEGVRLVVSARGGTAAEFLVGLGNDLPEVVDIVGAEGAVSGVVPVRFEVADSSDDRVDVRVEVSEQGKGDWRPARQAGLPGEAETPEYAFEGITARRTGTELLFFWDSEHPTQAGDRDAVICMRFAARDEVGVGASLEAPPLEVDNNAAPIVVIEEGSFTANPDARAGIPIAYRLIDQEGDDLRVLFQWRRDSQPGFPSLEGLGAEELTVALQDPDWRREKQVCSRMTTAEFGMARVLDVSTLELPGIVYRQAASRDGLEGRTIEYLRSPLELEDVSSRWPSNALHGPVASLPLANRTSALVLDGVGGQSRLVELELTSGFLERVIAQLSGRPSAVAWGSGRDEVLVATSGTGDWAIRSVGLETGVVEELVESSALSGPDAPLRSLVSIGEFAALATAGSSIWRIDWRNRDEPRARRVVRGLAKPWGLVLDPTRPGSVWVAERDSADPRALRWSAPVSSGRILSVDLLTGERTAIVEGFGPTGMCLDRSGKRLLFLGREELGTDLMALYLESNEVVSLGKTARGARSVGADHGVVLVVEPEGREVRTAGGVVARSTIVDHALSTDVVEVADPVPAVTGSRLRYSIPPPDPFVDPLSSSPEGRRHVFTWNSHDVPGGGAVRIQAMPFDEKAGIPSATSAPKDVKVPLDREPVLVTGPGISNDVSLIAGGDLDRDGLVDLVLASSDHIAILRQEAPAQFSSSPLLLGGPGLTPGLRDLALADLDGDGDLDVVSASPVSDTLMVFHQLRPLEFSSGTQLGGPPSTDGLRGVDAVDMNGDGRIDLLATVKDSVVVFLQDDRNDFLEPVEVMRLRFLTRAVPADLDGDGDIDLVVEALSTYFAEQVEPGEFELTRLQGAFGAVQQVIDVDGDGALDLVTPLVILASSGQSFVRSKNLEESGLSVVASDLDGDGDVDLALPFSQGTKIYSQVSPWEFQESIVETDAELRANVTPIALDLDRNGRVDLVTGARDGVAIFFAGPTSSWRDRGTTTHLLEGDLLGDFGGIVRSADVDGDGAFDLVVGGGNGLFILLQTAPGFLLPAPLSVDPDLQVPLALELGDLDRDGLLDIVSSTFFGQLRVIQQETPGVFGEPKTIDSRLGLARVVDGDADGRLDIEAFTPSQLVRYPQGVDGEFLEPRVVLDLGDEQCGFPCRALDIDGDTDLDVLSVNRSEGSLSVLFQGPNRSIDRLLELGGRPVTSNMWSVVVGDVDGDDDADLVTPNLGVGTVTIFTQSSAGEFELTPRVLSPDTNGSLHVATADVDGDLDVDLVIGSNGGDYLAAVYLQTAPGRFASPIPIRATGSDNRVWGEILVKDLDGDGGMELVFVEASFRTGVKDQVRVIWGGR